MAITMNMMFEGFTPEQYDEVRRLVGWESDPSKGAIFHVASFGPAYTPGVDGAMYVTDIWESINDWELFQTQLLPTLAKLGINTAPTVVILDTHTAFVADSSKLDALKRPLTRA